MTTHHTRKTRNRIIVVLAVLVIGYLIFDKGMEKYHKKMGIHDIILAKEEMKVAPDWSLKNFSGEVFESEYLKGDVSLIVFWVSTCHVCLSEIPLLKELDSEYKEKGFKIVAISLDELDDADLQAFVKAENIHYIVLRGDSKVTKQFGGIELVPQAFLIDRKSNIIKYFLGPIDKAEIKSLINRSL